MMKQFEANQNAMSQSTVNGIANAMKAIENHAAVYCNNDIISKVTELKDTLDQIQNE